METVQLTDSPPSASLQGVALHPEKENTAPKHSQENSTAVSDANGSPDAQMKASKSVKWSEKLVSESTYTPIDVDTSGSNPYVSHSSSPPLSSTPSFKETVDTVRNVLGRWGRNVKDAAKKAEDYAGNTWQHCMIS